MEACIEHEVETMEFLTGEIGGVCSKWVEKPMTDGLEFTADDGLSMHRIFIHMCNFNEEGHGTPHFDLQWPMDSGNHETMDRIVIEAFRNFSGCPDE